MLAMLLPLCYLARYLAVAAADIVCFMSLDRALIAYDDATLAGASYFLSFLCSVN